MRANHGSAQSNPLTLHKNVAISTIGSGKGITWGKERYHARLAAMWGTALKF